MKTTLTICAKTAEQSVPSKSRDTILIILVGLLCIWVFGPRPKKALPQTATFANVIIYRVGANYLTFSSTYDELHVKRLKIQNMPAFYQKLKWLQVEDAEIDLKLLPSGKEWEIVNIENPSPVATLPSRYK